MPTHIVKNRVTKRSFERITEKVGLVYFGSIGRDDDHRLVRGHTVSSTHIDDHYSVGSINGYDCMLVLRNDVIVSPRAPHSESRCHWLICSVDLKTQNEVPHIYIGHASRDELFKASFERIIPLNLAGFSQRFNDHYTIYGRATYGELIEQYIDAATAETIALHFNNASIEIEDNTLYVYIESKHPDEVLIEKMLSNGLWLAQVIDAKSVN
jgi:hypothetical protein